MGHHKKLGKTIRNIVRKLSTASKLRFLCPQDRNKALKTSFGFGRLSTTPLLFDLNARNLSEAQDRLDIDKAGGLETGKRQFPNKNGSFK